MHKQAMIIQGSVRLPEVGKIKIGRKGKKRKSRNGKDMQDPKMLNEILVTTLERDPKDDDNLIVDKKAVELYGKKIKEIPILLLFDEIGLNFQSMYSYWRGQTAVCSGDGVVGQHIQEDGSIEEIECPCGYQDPKQAGGARCKMSGKLSCMIRDMPQVGGVYVHRTRGYNTTTGMAASLGLISSVTKGTLAGVPLYIVAYRKATKTPEGIPTTITALRIEYRGTIQELLESSYSEKKMRIEHGVNMERMELDVKKLLDVKAEVIGEDEAEYAAEFVPTGTDDVTDITEPEVEKTEEEVPAEVKPATKGPDMTEAGKYDPVQEEEKPDTLESVQAVAADAKNQPETPPEKKPNPADEVMTEEPAPEDESIEYNDADFDCF